MDVYLVGGAVRDALLNRPVREKDWVVVGSTPEEMLRLGYRQVGRDFPVFLHPESGEEYALARTERKTGPGHTGFVCHAGADVTLEDDLRRRDLTVNAMARAGDDTLIDPFGGRDDLAAGCLRHVSEAFVEDPLRVFRVARFAAQLPGFRVAPQTLALMRRMAERGELAELAAERVWRELDKALDTDAPDAFFTVLAAAAAMAPWFVELAPASRLPAALKRPEQRFGALAWGRPLTSVRQLCKRLKAPKRFAGLAERVAAHGAPLADWRTGSPQTLHDALAGIGALDPQRDPGPVMEVIEACAGTDLAALAALARRLAAVVAAPYLARGLTGPQVGEAMRRERLELIETELAGA